MQTMSPPPDQPTDRAGERHKSGNPEHLRSRYYGRLVGLTARLLCDVQCRWVLLSDVVSGPIDPLVMSCASSCCPVGLGTFDTRLTNSPKRCNDPLRSQPISRSRVDERYGAYLVFEVVTTSLVAGGMRAR